MAGIIEPMFHDAEGEKKRVTAFARELCAQPLDISQRCHRLIGWFYERTVTDMGRGLTIVSLPSWMDAKDVDLIKTALKHYADAQ